MANHVHTFQVARKSVNQSGENFANTRTFYGFGELQKFLESDAVRQVFGPGELEIKWYKYDTILVKTSTFTVK